MVALHPSDPVDLGVAASLARPGGNITGQTLRAPGIGGKQLELIAEMQPSAKRFVFGQSISVHPMVVVEADEAARKRGVKFASSDMPHTGDYDAWIAKTKREGAHAMIFTLDASTFAPARRTALAAALIKHKLPAMCGVAEYVEAGCLMSYGAAFIEFYPRGAEYVRSEERRVGKECRL